MNIYYHQQLLTQLSEETAVTLHFWESSNQFVESMKPQWCTCVVSYRQRTKLLMRSFSLDWRSEVNGFGFFSYMTRTFAITVNSREFFPFCFQNCQYWNSWNLGVFLNAFDLFYILWNAHRLYVRKEHMIYYIWF